MKKLSSINAYILGGGKSKRMSSDKAFLQYNGKTLLDITIERCASIFERVFLVGREYQNQLLKGCFSDEINEIGPLGGIYTALKRTDSDYNFFVGIDYPFISPELILALAHSFLKRTPLYEGCIPVAPDGIHPLFAYYGRSCLSSIKRCISEKNYRIRCIARYSRIYFFSLVDELGEKMRAKIVRAFININSYDDYIFTKNHILKEEKKL